MNKIDRSKEVRLWIKALSPYLVPLIGSLYLIYENNKAMDREIDVQTARFREREKIEDYRLKKMDELFTEAKKERYEIIKDSRLQLLKQAENKGYKTLHYSRGKWNEVKSRFTLMEGTFKDDGYYYAAFNDTHYYIMIED